MRAAGLKTEIRNGSAVMSGVGAHVFLDVVETKNRECRDNFHARKLVRRGLHSRKFLRQRSLVTLVYGSYARASIIFFLTSLFNDSIPSISCNGRSLL